MELKIYNEHYKNIIAVKRKYQYTNSFAGELLTESGEPLAVITVCLDNEVCNNSNDLAYVDTNNCSWAEEFIKENNLGEFVGSYGQSGFCSYPLYKFDTQKFINYEEI